MRTVGVFLIHAGVFLRCLYRLPRLEQPAWVIALLVLNALLLAVEAWAVRREARHPMHTTDGPTGFRPLYLLLQAAIVIALLFNRPLLDFFALLFTPLSMSAVLFYGRRGGFVWIAAFTLAMAVPLIALHPNRPFGAVMALNYGGLCFLMGGYAHQIRQAQAARGKTQAMLDDLQDTHGRLLEAAGQREELAAEHERNRLAREMHDSVTQTVFSMNLTVQAARLLLNRDPGRVAGQLQRLEELAANAMREIQALVASLCPAPAADEGLPDALRRLAGQLGEALHVTLEVTGDRALPQPTAAALYLVAQEALTNVARHAGVHAATVRLGLGEGPAFLEVEDRGRGFVPQAVTAQHGHLGLAGMAERAADLGWRLMVASQPGRGTLIRVEERPAGGIP